MNMKSNRFIIGFTMKSKIKNELKIRITRKPNMCIGFAVKMNKLPVNCKISKMKMNMK